MTSRGLLRKYPPPKANFKWNNRHVKCLRAHPQRKASLPCSLISTQQDRPESSGVLAGHGGAEDNDSNRSVSFYYRHRHQAADAPIAFATSVLVQGLAKDKSIAAISCVRCKFVSCAAVRNGS